MGTLTKKDIFKNLLMKSIRNKNWQFVVDAIAEALFDEESLHRYLEAIIERETQDLSKRRFLLVDQGSVERSIKNLGHLSQRTMQAHDEMEALIIMGNNDIDLLVVRFTNPTIGACDYFQYVLKRSPNTRFCVINPTLSQKTALVQEFAADKVAFWADEEEDAKHLEAIRHLFNPDHKPSAKEPLKKIS